MTSNKHEVLFPVGKIVGFRGLKGEVKIIPKTNSPELLLNIENVNIILANGSQLNALVREIYLRKGVLFLSFTNFADRNSVEALANAEVYVSRNQLSALEEEEFWISDLVGVDVFTTSGAFVGRILSIAGDTNQILEISSDLPGKTILVPFVKQLVPTIDLKHNRIEVADLPGLLEAQ